MHRAGRLVLDPLEGGGAFPRAVHVAARHHQDVGARRVGEGVLRKDRHPHGRGHRVLRLGDGVDVEVGGAEHFPGAGIVDDLDTVEDQDGDLLPALLRGRQRRLCGLLTDEPGAADRAGGRHGNSAAAGLERKGKARTRLDPALRKLA